MKLDENEFFRQATLRICSSLDVEKAMLNCLSYIRAFVPVSELKLSLLEPRAGIYRNLASVSAEGCQ
ncbi:MAG: sigma-54-dependent Fis family transcriptional regulator, partial [Syntrophobacter sp.]